MPSLYVQVSPILLALLLCAPALADAAQGGSELKLNGRLGKTRVIATDPGSAKGGMLSLPVYDATIGSTAKLRHSGVVQLKQGGARLTFTAWRTTLGKHSKSTAVVDGKRRTILTYGGTAKVDASGGTARLKGAPARLTGFAVKAIRRALGADDLKPGRVGTADITVTLQHDAGAGLVWRPRESFIRYINSETGSTSVSGGAENGPKEVRPGSDVPLVYSFRFPTGKGTLAFTWQERGIDLSFTDPEIAGSQLMVTFGGTTSGDYASKRLAMLDLEPASEAGTYVATLTEDGSKAFAGFYSPGDEWGTVIAAQPSRRSAQIARAKRKPKRIVALSPFTANTLVDLGVKPIAIANTLGGQDRFRRQLKGVKRLELSHPNGPNLEQLAALEPDVVLSSPTWRRGHAAMRELGVKVVLADPTKVANVAAMTRKLGRLVGRRKLARQLATRQQEAIEDAKVGIKEHPRVLAVLGVGRSPYAFLPDSWGGDLVLQAGGDLLTKGLEGEGGFAKISDEQVVAINPDVIIAVPHGRAKDIPSTAEYLKNNPSWQSTNAAKNDRVYVARGNSLLQPFTDMGRTIRDIGNLFLKNR